MGGAIAFSGDCAFAQIIPDTTLGSENSTVTSTDAVDQINGGATRGANLFHSFQEFSVKEGRAAVFTNPAGIENILTRVTGANPSNILGTLGVSGGNASLFLINPNGILFGANARLAVGGSFVATTANAIRLANGDFFSASPGEPLPTALLNVNPNAFFFNQVATQPIINRSIAMGTGLEVPQGQSLLLVGGDIQLEGGQMQAPGGRVELGGVAGAGTVGLNVDSNNLGLSFPDDLARADVSLANGAEVNVSAGNTGSIAINAHNLNLEGESKLQAGIDSGLGSVDSRAGDIEINTTGAITLTGATSLTQRSSIANSVQPGAIGQGGNIRITAGSLSVTKGGEITTSTKGRGNAGSVIIDAREKVEFESGQGDGRNFASSRAYSRVEKGAEGKAGDIHITTGSLSVIDGAFLSASTNGTGNAGHVFIDARDTVEFAGVGADGISSGAYSQVLPNAMGQGGSVNIKTGSLFVKNGAQLNANTRGQGNAGGVNINARDAVSLDGVGSNNASSAVSSQVERGVEGNSGDINIKTG
jgi:filamentous hemagglutinin family protein